MANSTINGAQISGMVTCVPSQTVSIEAMSAAFATEPGQLARMKRTLGLDERRIAGAATTAADLCYEAGRALIEGLDLERSSIDGLICVTQTPDHSQPCNATQLQARLGLSKHCASFDVSLGCSGYVYGLYLAKLMVANGGCRRVLLLAGDTLSKVVHSGDRALQPLFGDGGSATLIDRSEAADQSFFRLGTDGEGARHLIVPAGGMRQRVTQETAVVQTDESGIRRSQESLHMDGGEVFNFSITTVPESIRELLEYANLSVEAVDLFAFHQANHYILKNIAKRIGAPIDRVLIRAFSMFGNLSSASIPSALCLELEGRKRSKKQPIRLLLSGFGVGLSWGSALIAVGDLKVCRVIDYPSDS